MLHVTHEALEDGCVATESLAGAHVPIYCGVLTSDFQTLSLSDGPSFDLYGCVNTSFAALAGRVAHVFDWSGAAVGLDTACSSSLVALQLACQAIDSGAAETAVAGGSNLVLLPECSQAFTRAGMLAGDGRCKAFDAAGDGFVRSEGVAAVVVKSLPAALRDGNPIHALVRAVRLNHDGGRGQYKTPNRAGQAALLESIYAETGIDPLETMYVEAHGTGTRAGDPVEAGALADVLCAGRRRDAALRLGSVKTNLGHCEAAAGMAGLIKASLAVNRRVIPANLHFQTPNPKIPWDTVPMRVPTEAEEWPSPSDVVARAGVSAFGLTGVNAHVIVEEPPRPKATQVSVPRPLLWALSAPDRDRLTRVATGVAEAADAGNAEAVARTLAVGRTRRPLRAALWGRDPAELLASAEALGRGEPVPTGAIGEALDGGGPRVCFVFSGQGGQWLGMGRQLLTEEPVFRARLEDVAERMRGEADIDPLVELSRPADEARFEELEVVQPLIFAVQLGLAALWRSLGVQPAAVIGHSMGEVAAAHEAGILSLPDAVRVICRRSQLMARVAGRGAMLVVGLRREDATALASRTPESISVAVNNSPQSTVLSGEPEVLRSVAEELESKDVFCRFVNVDVASHSPQMEPLEAELRASLAAVVGQRIDVPMHSTVRPRFGRRPEDAPDFDASYWWENLRHTVQFADAVAEAIRQGAELFLEVNPHPVLCQAIRQSEMATPDLAALPSLLRDEDERLALLQTAGDLFTRGVPVDLPRLCGAGPLLRLPPTPLLPELYPADFERYLRRGRAGATDGVHPLVAAEIRPAERPDEVRWTVMLSPAEQPLWAGHVVQGEMVFPGAGYLDLALSLGRRLLGGGAVEAADFVFERALFLEATEETELQVVARRRGTDAWRVDLLACDGTRHAHGLVRPAADPPPALEPGQGSAPGVARDDGAAFYAWLDSLGLFYRGPFRRLAEVTYGDREGLGVLAPADGTATEGFAAHPAVLDACFQASFSTMLALRNGEPALYLPTGVASLTLYADSLGGARRVLVERGEGTGDETFDASLTVLDAAGHTLARVERLRATRLADTTRPTDDAHGLWRLAWQESPLSRPVFPDQLGRRRWLVRTDGTGPGARVADLLEQQGCRVWRVRRSLRAGDRFEVLGPRSFLVRAGVPGDVTQLLDHVAHDAEGPIEGVLDFWPLLESPLEASTGDEVALAVERVCLPVLYLVQELAARSWAPKTWLFTRGAWAPSGGKTAEAAARSALWGLGRVLQVEHPELACTLVGLSDEHDIAPEVLDELIADGDERELRLDGAERRVARLEPAPRRAAVSVVEERSSADTPFRLEWDVEGRLVALQAAAPELQEGEAAVDVLNLLVDRPSSHDRRPAASWGTAVGGVVREGDGLQAGQRVAWLGAPRGVTSTVALPAEELWVLPEQLYLPDALASQGPYLGAFHALITIAGLGRGDRVLVAASAPLALAAAHLSRWSRAEVVAVVVGGDPGGFAQAGFRDVVDSAAADAAVRLSQAYAGVPADVLLVEGGTGDHLELTHLLDEAGRCVWLPGRASGRPPAVRDNQELHAVTLGRRIARRDSTVVEALARVRELLAGGVLPTLSAGRMSLSDALADPELGTALVEPVLLTLDERTIRVSRPPQPVRSDASYLVTGGLGGLGSTVAKALVEAGARSLVLVGRRPASAEVRPKLDELERMGAQVAVLQADVARAADLRHVLAYVAEHLPPLAGVVHSAGILADAIALRQDARRFAEVLPPKVQGAWNLHRQTRDLGLELFVLFSSAAGLLGSPGQANYAAANTFLDGLARGRRAEGLPAQTLQWGPWAEVGLAARPDRGGRLAERGLPSLSPQEGAALFLRALARREPTLAAMHFEPAAWAASHPAVAGDRRLSLLTTATPPGTIVPATAATPTAALAPQPPSETTGDVLGSLVAAAAKVLRVPTQRVDSAAPLTGQGFDSLMLVELRQAIEAATGADIPVATLMKGASLEGLASELAPAAPAAPQPTTTPAQSPDAQLGLLRAAAASVLRIPEGRVDPARPLSEQGLDSLMMIELRQQIEAQLGVDVPVAVLMKGPTLEQLAQRLADPEAGRPAADPGAAPMGVEKDLALPREVRVTPATGLRGAPARVLLTGATGHLGAYLLAALIDGGMEVCCLVRGVDDAQARERLERQLAARGLAVSGRFDVVAGDLSRSCLGLGEEGLAERLAATDAVVLNGAAVQFEQPYAELRETNVLSWLDVLRHVRSGQTVLHLVSSWAVFSVESRAGQVVGEADWPTEMPTGGYRQTKFVAERLACEAQQRGLAVQVHRPALVSAHAVTGEPNPRELFASLLATVVATGLAPELDLRVPLLPVDVVAAGMAQAIGKGEPVGHALHWAHPEPLRWSALLDDLEARDVTLQRLPYATWRRRVEPATPAALQPFLAVLPEELGETFGYLEAALADKAPHFETTGTCEAFPEIAASPSGVSALAAYIDRLLAGATTRSGATPPR